MKTLTEAQKTKLTEGILDLIWKRSMQGKTKGLMKMFDHDPQVAKSIEDLEKARQNLKATLRDSDELLKSLGY